MGPRHGQGTGKERSAGHTGRRPRRPPKSNQPDLQPTPHCTRRRVGGGGEIGGRAWRGMNNERFHPRPSRGDQGGGERGDGDCIRLALRQNLPGAPAVIFMRRLGFFRAAGVLGPNQLGQKRSLAAASPQTEHQHGQHRGEATEVGQHKGVYSTWQHPTAVRSKQQRRKAWPPGALDRPNS